jgi:nicotinamidase-related amidase
LVNAEQAAENARLLLSNCRDNELPVVYLQHTSMQPGATFMLPDTDGITIHKKVQPLASEKVIIKHYPNSFRDTGLKEYLAERGINHLILCGMMSHMCVDATVRAAFDLGFECVVAHDACTTRNLQFGEQVIDAPEVHGSFMAALSAVYAQIMTTEECLQ